MRPGTALVFSILLVLPVAHPAGQSFRGDLAGRHEFSDGETYSFESKPGEVTLWSVSERFPFVTGIEVTITTPEDVSLPTGAFSLHAYDSVDPGSIETSGIVTMAGRSLGTSPIESGAPRDIPIAPLFSDRDAADSDGFTGANPERGAIALQIVPASKGLGPGLESVTFTVEVTPQLAGVGGIEIRLEGEAALLDPSREELEITLDDQPIAENTLIVRDPGIYRLEVNAGDYLKRTENIGVEAAQTTRRTFTVHEPRAFLNLSVPSVAEVFIDGSRVSSPDREPLVHTPGRYSLLIRLGDYVISRRVDLEAHGTYEIGLDLDILIKRD